ncbi:hypothetical protein, partial [Mesorhizobium sp. M1405]|uniref:hypothetical protein n=1 Tax=Mesorhizobium sp. M1405 TaxID=2957098 RepID=UPI00333615E0
MSARISWLFIGRCFPAALEHINYQIVSLCDMVKSWPRKINRNKGGRDERVFFISAIHENVDCVIYWCRYLFHRFREYMIALGVR